jgi:hypothetical protein
VMLRLLGRGHYTTTDHLKCSPNGEKRAFTLHGLVCI